MMAKRRCQSNERSYMIDKGENVGRKIPNGRKLAKGPGIYLSSLRKRKLGENNIQNKRKITIFPSHINLVSMYWFS